MKILMNLLLSGVIFLNATCVFADIKMISEKKITLLANKEFNAELKFNKPDVSVEVEDLMDLPKGVGVYSNGEGFHFLCGKPVFDKEFSVYNVPLIIRSGSEKVREILTINVCPVMFRAGIVGLEGSYRMVSEGDNIDIRIFDVETMSEPFQGEYLVEYLCPDWMWYDEEAFHGVVLVFDSSKFFEEYQVLVRISYIDKATGVKYTSNEQNIVFMRNSLVESAAKIFENIFNKYKGDLHLISPKKLKWPVGEFKSYKLEASDPDAIFQIKSELPPGLRLEQDGADFYLSGKIDVNFNQLGVKLLINKDVKNRSGKYEVITIDSGKEVTYKKLSSPSPSTPSPHAYTTSSSSTKSSGGGSGAGVAAGVLGAIGVGGLLWWALS